MAHFKKARLIVEATIKTDELDAKRLINLKKEDFSRNHGFRQGK